MKLKYPTWRLHTRHSALRWLLALTVILAGLQGYRAQAQANWTLTDLRQTTRTIAHQLVTLARTRGFTAPAISAATNRTKPVAMTKAAASVVLQELCPPAGPITSTLGDEVASGYPKTTSDVRTQSIGFISSASSCNTTPTCSPTNASFLFDSYTFAATTAACVTVNLASQNTTQLSGSVYLTSFDKADACSNLVGYTLGCTTNGTFSFNVPAGTTFIVVVEECNPETGFGTPYSLTVSGACATCVITCPANITTANAPNQCGAVVNYPAPTVTGDCSTITCAPPSGSFFPKGTTTVTCEAATLAPPSCNFTVTVNDTQPPTITCPVNQTITSSPNGSPTVATYPAPTVTDNCPGVTTVCVPASGSSFPIGTTTVTCTARDAVLNTASCSFTVTVTRFTPAPTMTLIDPLACVGTGDVVNGSATVTNTSTTNQTGTLTTALPAGIIGLPNTCVATVGTCTINATTVSWSGTLTPGQAITYNYQAQIGDSIVNGTTLCASTTATFGTVSNSVPGCLTVNCPPLGPGLPNGASPVTDQKPGSVLFYNLVSSSATNASTQNARISLTNTHPTRTAFLHLFFVDGASCAVADSFICLTPNQTATVLHSDIDPGVTGYVVAVATDRTGCPINFNYLIGDEYVKLSSGHAANLAAESIAARAGGATFCAPTASDAVLAFNDVAYDAVPRVLALDNFAAPADGNQTLLVVNRVGGYLSTGAFTTGTLFGLLYDDAEQALSFSLAGACQVRANLNGSTIRTTPRVEQFVPTGRTGWLKLYNNLNDFGILGAALNFNSNAATQAGAFNQGHNLHKLRLSQAAVYTIPIFPPSC